MSDLKHQSDLTDGKGQKGIYKAITPSKELKDKVKKKVKEIAKPFVDESVLIRHLTKKDKD